MSKTTTCNTRLRLANPQLTFPLELYQDSRLEPVDRNVWVAIKLHGVANISGAAFPTYNEIMLRCGIHSKATVSRSIAILRSCRWLTSGGSIYELHDAPIQSTETVAMDEHYLTFLQATAEGRQNPHPRVIRIATAILHDVQNNMNDDSEVSKLKLFFHRISSQRGKHPLRAPALYLDAPNSSKPAVILPVPSELPEKQDEDQYRICTVSGGGTDSVPRSSSYIYINTTTTTVSASEKSVLVWPASLDSKDRGYVAEQLRTVPEHHHQPVLDALKATLANIIEGRANPIRSLPAYTLRLCKLSIEGRLNPVIPFTAPAKSPPVTNDANSAVLVIPSPLELMNLSNEIKALQGFQKIEPEGSSQWIAYGEQITTKKAQWYRMHDLLTVGVLE